MTVTRAGARAVTLASVLLGSWAGPVSAASPAAADLADGVEAGVTVDLDADGAREIVAIISDDAGQKLVAWRETDGAWDAIGEVRIAGSSTGSGVRPLAPADGSGLLLLKDGPRERAILATIPTGGSSASQCCLSLFDIGVTSGQVQLAPIARGLGLASSIESADLDADGREELIVQAPIDPTGPEPPFETVRILRLGDGSVVEEPVRVPEDAGFLVAIGDSDGIPGDDLHFLGGGVVTRLTVAGPRLATETGVLPNTTAGLAGQWIVGATGGVLLTVDATGRVVVIRWPRGEAPVSTASVTSGPFASVFVLGEGTNARVVTTGSMVRSDEPMRTTVYDLDLRLEAQAEVRSAVTAMFEVAISPRVRADQDEFRPRPQFGPLGETPGGGHAFLAPGSMLVLAGDGELATGTTVPFAGEGAMGLAGPDGAWVVSGLGSNSAYPTSASLIGGASGTRLAVVPLDRLVGAAEGRAPDLEVTSGVVAAGPDGNVVYVDGAGLGVEVRAARGARVIGLAGSGTDVATVTDAPATLALRPEEAAEGAPPERAIVVVVEPGGIARVATWDAVVLDQPDLRATSRSRPFEPRSEVTGRVTGPATVTVDGMVVPTRPDGTFSAEVEAPIWGREVGITAVDPLGREAVERLTVIGFVDYRLLPWLPILAVGTGLMGVVLYLRAPRGPEPPVATAREGDGRLEEVDPDPIPGDGDS